MIRSARRELREKAENIRKFNSLAIIIDPCLPAQSYALARIATKILKSIAKIHIFDKLYLIVMYDQTVDTQTLSTFLSKVAKIVKQGAKAFRSLEFELVHIYELEKQPHRRGFQRLLKIAGLARLDQSMLLLLPYARDVISHWIIGAYPNPGLVKVANLVTSENIVTPLVHTSDDYAAYAYLTGLADNTSCNSKLIDNELAQIQSKSPEYAHGPYKLLWLLARRIRRATRNV